MSWIRRQDLYGVRTWKDGPQPPTAAERQRESGHVRAVRQGNSRADLTTELERSPSEQPLGAEEARHRKQVVFHEDSLEA